MLILIAVLFLCLLPIISYLLSPISPQKPLIFLITVLLLGAFLLNHTSLKPLFGQWVFANQSSAIYESLNKNLEVSDLLLDSFLSQMGSSEDSFLLGAKIFYKSIDMQSFTSAESILSILNTGFQDQNFQVPIYNLLADLRDAKYPMVSGAKLLLAIEEPSDCKIKKLSVIVNIPNGPDVDIAAKNFFLPDLSAVLSVDKSDALVRGFDLPSAFLNQEIIQLEVLGSCEKNTFHVFKTLDLQYSDNHQDKVFIYANEWLKKEQ
jgi:hypothetical protein